MFLILYPIKFRISGMTVHSRLCVVLPDKGQYTAEVRPLSPVVVPTHRHQLQHLRLQVLKFVDVGFARLAILDTFNYICN